MEETDMFSGLGADGMQDPNFITVDNYGSSHHSVHLQYFISDFLLQLCSLHQSLLQYMNM